MRVGLGGTVPVTRQGIREIDRQLMYSAAWLDDGRPGLVSVAGGAGRAVLSVLLEPGRPRPPR